MVAIHRKPAAPALHLDHLTDAMHGLNVRPDDYLDLTAAPVQPEPRYPWDGFVPQECFIVSVWDDGLDCGYFDDYPDYHVSEYHATRKGAECHAAWLERAGIEASRIIIGYGYQNLNDYDKPILP